MRFYIYQAKEAKIKLSLRDFRGGRKTPVLADLKPSGDILWLSLSELGVWHP